MKKIYFTIFFLAIVAGSTRAQRPVGDTLAGMYYDYYNNASNLNCWPIGECGVGWKSHVRDWILVGAYGFLNIHYETHHEGNYIGGMQMYTDRPLKILGIAVCSYMQRPADTTLSDYLRILCAPSETVSEYLFLNTRDTTLRGRITDSAILYKPTANGPVKLQAGAWRIEHPHRFIHLPETDSADVSFSWSIPDPVLPLYEVMFDSAVVVEDSFIVASTAFNNEMSPGLERLPCDPSVQEVMRLWDHNPTRFYLIESPNTRNTHGDSTSIAWVKYRNYGWARLFGGDMRPDGRYIDGVWHWLPGDTMRVCTRAYPFFPIIEVGFDTTLCHEVNNLRVAARGAGSATLMWDSGDGGPWIVAHGNISDAWSDFIYDTVSVPMITLTGLETNTQYFAVVRGYCSIIDDYGNWSAPLEVEIYTPGTEPEGIEHPGNLAHFTTLLPNPARDVVNVLSSYKMNRIAVYDLSGRKLLEQAADGISAIVDISTLPSGTYITAIYLPHGVATKKLLVE